VGAMATMSVADIRKHLGKLNTGLTDEQVQKLGNSMIQIAYFCVQEAKKQWNNQQRKL